MAAMCGDVYQYGLGMPTHACIFVHVFVYGGVFAMDWVEMHGLWAYFDYFYYFDLL
jgi:hypothetical protein